MTLHGLSPRILATQKTWDQVVWSLEEPTALLSPVCLSYTSKQESGVIAYSWKRMNYEAGFVGLYRTSLCRGLF